jgi:MutS domain V
MHSREEFYSARIGGLVTQKNDLVTRASNISRVRLLVALSFCATSYLGVADYSNYYFIPSIFLATAFVYLVKRHTALKDNIIVLSIILVLNENELKGILGKDPDFEPGPAADYLDHIYANDLDIFGKLSLFRDINRTSTLLGKQIVIDNLLSPPKDNQLIRKRKELLTELETDIDRRQQFYAQGHLSREKATDVPNLDSWNSQTDFFASQRYWLVVAFAVTVVNICLIIYMLLVGKFSVLPFSLVFLFNTFIHQLFFRKKAAIYFTFFRDFNVLFFKWSELCLLIENRNYKSALGNELKESIGGASTALAEISNLNKLVALRQNAFMFSLVNGFFLFDVFFIRNVENWKKKHGQNLFPWIETIVEMDSLNSFANYKFNHPTFCEAEITEGHHHIAARALGHPLMRLTKLVTNDFEIGRTAKAHVITGSNMSGKSTFLRSIGLNVVLALNGLPVCATSFSCSNVSIASCIRVTDSLEENESYFRAELNKLSRIMAFLATEGPCLVLLDEILRGTNSEDKRIGTKLFYRKLGSQNCISLLATHDPEIGQLVTEFPDTFENFHFESFIEGSDIRFDYFLRPGVSTTTNATVLMRKLGLL